jgi:hypothetical protein
MVIAAGLIEPNVPQDGKVGLQVLKVEGARQLALRLH